MVLKNVAFTNCTIGDEFQSNYPNGGALSIKNSGLILSNSVFQRVIGHNGACVYSESDFQQSSSRRLLTSAKLKTTISNCRFLNNEARKFGGVLYLKDVDSQIQNSEFLENNAKKGGVVYANTRNKDRTVYIQ